MIECLIVLNEGCERWQELICFPVSMCVPASHVWFLFVYVRVCAESAIQFVFPL